MFGVHRFLGAHPQVKVSRVSPQGGALELQLNFTGKPL